jgi:Tfp pilus assembly protein PilO
MAEATTTRRINVRKVLATTQGQTYAVAGATIFIVILMVFLAIRPAFLSISDQNAKNDVKRAYLDQLTEFENNLKILAQQKSDMQAQIDELNMVVPDKRNDEFVAANVNAIVQKYQVQLRILTFEKSVETKDPKLAGYPSLLAVPMRLSVSGSLSNLQLFLAELETFPLPISVSAIGYSGTDIQAIDPLKQIDLDIDAQYYYFLNTIQ